MFIAKVERVFFGARVETLIKDFWEQHANAPDMGSRSTGNVLTTRRNPTAKKRARQKEKAKIRNELLVCLVCTHGDRFFPQPRFYRAHVPETQFLHRTTSIYLFYTIHQRKMMRESRCH